MAGRDLKDKEHPLAGVVLCFTSILPEQRSELAAIASQMGAAHKFDLTSDVTHLLVGEPNTPKYKYVARERMDVVALMPEWIEAVRQSWMQGGDTDLRSLEKKYRVPTFFGLAICITGFEDISFRSRVEETVIANGGEFRKDLTKSVTHLIAREARGNKYEFATQWNINVASLKWFSESLERGMILDEDLYHPSFPVERQGIGAWNRSMVSISAKPEELPDFPDPRPRKIRRIASTKLLDQNGGIWNDIVGIQTEPLENFEPKPIQQRTPEGLPTTDSSLMQELQSFASETIVTEMQGSRSTDGRPAELHEGFLQSSFFFIYGFTKKQTDVLRYHLEFNGARIVNSLSEMSSPCIPKKSLGLYIIVPYKMPRAEVPSTDDMAFESEIVTDMWLERCLNAKALVPPETHVTSTPFPRFPIPGFHDMRICSTGFTGLDLLHLSKLANAMGATYDEYLTRSASVLICNNPQTASQEKLRHTSEWGVPTVSADWLWISAQTGDRKSFDPYLVRRLPSQSMKAGKERSKPSEQPNRSTLQSPRNGELIDLETSIESRTNIPLSDEDDNAIPSPSIENRVYENPASITRNRLSTSLSPGKGQAQSEIPFSHEGSVQSWLSNNTKSTGSKALDLAVSGLLKQARARSYSSNNTEENVGRLNVKKRKPLLGRVGSSVGPIGYSRASSIDTLNEDGCGSTDGPDAESKRPNRLTRNGQSFNSAISGSGIDLYSNPPIYEEGRVEIEPEVPDPPLTQLNYEDPDAVAMREKLMRHAGKTGNEEPVRKNLVLGELRDLEDTGGWGTGRRTRKSRKVPEVGNGLF